MSTPPSTQRRRAALAFCLAVPVLVLCLLAWVAVLTFDVRDPPSPSVWPPHATPHNACGRAGAWVSYYLLYALGWGAYPLLALGTAGAIAKLRGAALPDLWLRGVGAAVLVLACSAAGSFAVAQLHAGPNSRPVGVFESWLQARLEEMLDAYPVAGPGGIVGMVAADFLGGQVKAIGTLVILCAAVLVGLVLAVDELVVAAMPVLGWAGRLSGRAVVTGSQVVVGAASAGLGRVSGRLAAATAGASRAAEPTGESAEPPAPRASGTAVARPVSSVAGEVTPSPAPVASDQPPEPLAREARSAAGEEDVTPAGSAAPATAAASVPVITHTGGSATTLRSDPRPAPRPPTLFEGSYTLPPLTLLDDPTPIDREATEIVCREKAAILETTLAEFRIEVRVVTVDTGPVITVFELKLAPGVKVSQIISLGNDLARALKAPAVRVVAPLPGKNTIGIEVPNLAKEKVRIKDLIRAAGARSRSHAVPMFLGKDAAGAPVVVDLTTMPHLLVAGTTGSGKSICVSSIIMSVLMTKTPAEVNMILVDPKVVELAMFKDIPHLMCPIVTDPGKAEGILDWAATKMDERYALLAEAGVKDIRSYNALGRDKLRERFAPITEEELDRIPAQLPYIIIVVDELADLMMTSAKEVEFYLCRLAQKSRAVGIHLIVSTQRPQANVVTGLIKSNLPCRIAFRVSSRLDSRIVLDQNGGELLLGQGDMLFLPPGSSKLVRAQGTFISDDELRAAVKHCCAQASPQFHPELVRLPGAGVDAGERDEMFDQAVEIIIESGRGSVSLLQRRLTIGYSRASRLVDQMYAAGIVGEYKGSQAREVLMTIDDWNRVRAARDREEAAEADENDALDE